MCRGRVGEGGEGFGYYVGRICQGYLFKHVAKGFGIAPYAGIIDSPTKHVLRRARDLDLSPLDWYDDDAKPSVGCDNGKAARRQLT